jgi:hypothetical protein
MSANAITKLEMFVMLAGLFYNVQTTRTLCLLRCEIYEAVLNNEQKKKNSPKNPPFLKKGAMLRLSQRSSIGVCEADSERNMGYGTLSRSESRSGSIGSTCFRASWIRIWIH